MKLEFESRFELIYKRLSVFLLCETAERGRAMARKFPQTNNKVIREKIQMIFSHIKTGQQDIRRKTRKELKCDFKSWEELDDLFRVFEYRCVVRKVKGTPLNFMDPSYSNKFLRNTYGMPVNPVEVKTLADDGITLPPPSTKKVGRTKTQRIRSRGETDPIIN
jgi:hypothetical protein